MRTFSDTYLTGLSLAIGVLSLSAIEQVARILSDVRSKGGRLFMIGVGGSAAACSHAVNDFRKLCGIQAYSPCDNVSELTARANDEGWDTIFSGWLRISYLSENDAVFIISVGGGSKTVSPHIGSALRYSAKVGAKIIGIVGRDGGDTARLADACVVVPTINQCLVTPYTESLHGVILHLLASHPLLQLAPAKWESMQ
jgi:D-sedoheptulose 7-phosphate isomerase